MYLNKVLFLLILALFLYGCESKQRDSNPIKPMVSLDKSAKSKPRSNNEMHRKMQSFPTKGID